MALLPVAGVALHLHLRCCWRYTKHWSGLAAQVVEKAAVVVVVVVVKAVVGVAVGVVCVWWMVRDDDEAPGYSRIVSD